MKNPTVSVVIIAYNEEKYIGKTLDALIKQTVQPEEILVIDNNSTDNTATIAGKYKGVRVVSETEQGMSPARNRGFNEAKSKVLVKLDADTLLEKEFIGNIKEIFLKDGDIVGVVPRAIFPELIWRILFNWRTGSYATEFFLGYKTCPGPSYALTRKAWKRIKGNVCNEDKKIHEDTEISMHLDNVGDVVYAKNCNSVTSSRRIKERPWQFFIEYRVRLIRQFWNNRGLLKRFRIVWGHLSPYR